MPSMSDYHVVKNLELEKLSGANQVPSHLDVGLRRSWIAGWVVVLWDAGTYVLPYGKECWADSVASVIVPPRPTHEHVKSGV